MENIVLFAKIGTIGGLQVAMGVAFRVRNMILNVLNAPKKDSVIDAVGSTAGASLDHA